MHGHVRACLACGLLLAFAPVSSLLAQQGPSPRELAKQAEAKKVEREIDELEREHKARKEQLEAKLRLITQKGRFESELEKAGFAKPKEPKGPKIDKCEDIQRLYVR